MICNTAEGMDNMFESNVELEDHDVGSDGELLDLKRKNVQADPLERQREVALDGVLGDVCQGRSQAMLSSQSSEATSRVKIKRKRGKEDAQATSPTKTRHQRCLSAQVSRMSDQVMVFCSRDRPLAGSSRRILHVRQNCQFFGNSSSKRPNVG